VAKLKQIAEQIRCRSGYRPQAGAEHCPVCWVRIGIINRLRTEPHHNALGVFALVCDACGCYCLIGGASMSRRLSNEEKREERYYFAIFLLPKPQPEHAQIRETIKSIAIGDFKQVVIPGGILFAYKSTSLPWEVPLSTNKSVLNQDSFFITDMTGIYRQQGFGAIDGWLNAHFPHH
jgi:hypothetical protein